MQLGGDLVFPNSSHAGKRGDEAPPHALIDTESLGDFLTGQPSLEQVCGVGGGCGSQTVGIGNLVVRAGHGISKASREDGDETVTHFLAIFGVAVRDRGGCRLADECGHGCEVGFAGQAFANQGDIVLGAHLGIAAHVPCRAPTQCTGQRVR